MKRNVRILVFILAALGLSAAATFAHQGVEHSILGTVKEVFEDRMVVTKKDAKEVTILLTTKTACTRGKVAARHSDLAVGIRVVIQVEEDGKTAVTVKIGTAKTSG